MRPFLRYVAGLALALGLADCAHQRRDRVFEDRVAFFSSYAASLPLCAGDRYPSVKQMLASVVAPGMRVTVEGHPIPACTDERFEEPLVETVHPVPPSCLRRPGVWVLWPGPMPPATRLSPDEPACVHVTPDTLTDGLLLGPRPDDLMNCDWAAAERAMPSLKVAVTGKLAHLSNDKPIRGAELFVESVCRLP